MPCLNDTVPIHIEYVVNDKVPIHIEYVVNEKVPIPNAVSAQHLYQHTSSREVHIIASTRE